MQRYLLQTKEKIFCFLPISDETQNLRHQIQIKLKDN